MLKALAKQTTQKIRLTIAIEGTPIGVRVCPHKTDKTRLVLKCGHPELAGMLCQVMGIKPGATWQGSNFFITDVDAEAFQKAFPSFIAQSMKAARELDAESKPQLTEGKSQKCLDCGCDDGTHWAFCGTPKLLKD